eukprot:Opistho-1_new@31669
MRLMGGQIGVRSAVGKGSVFWCVLPLASTDAPPVPSAPGVPHSPATSASLTPPCSSGISTSSRTPEQPQSVTPRRVVAVGRTSFLDTVGTCAHLMGLPFEGHEVSSVATLSQACGHETTHAIVAIEWDAWILASGREDELLLPEGMVPVIFSARKHDHLHRLPVTREKLRLAIVQHDSTSSSLVSASDARGGPRGNEEGVCVRPPVTSSATNGAIEVSIEDAPDHPGAFPAPVIRASSNTALLHANREVKGRDVLVVEDNVVNRTIAL